MNIWKIIKYFGFRQVSQLSLGGVFYEKKVQNFVNFTGRKLCQSHFFYKVTNLQVTSSVRQAFLKILQISQENTCVGGSF